MALTQEPCGGTVRPDKEGEQTAAGQRQAAPRSSADQRLVRRHPNAAQAEHRAGARLPLVEVQHAACWESRARAMARSRIRRSPRGARERCLRSGETSVPPEAAPGNDHETGDCTYLPAGPRMVKLFKAAFHSWQSISGNSNRRCLR